MSEPKLLGLSRRRSRSQSLRRGFQKREAAACVERLEPRWLLTPTISSVTPFGVNGATVTVNGSGFLGATAVDFCLQGTSNRTTASFTPPTTDTLITVTVPSTLTASSSYYIEVTNGTTSAQGPTSVFTDVVPAAVGATVVKGLTSPITLTGAVNDSVPDIAVNSTADFLVSGNPVDNRLFVQTDKGVATIQYTGMTDTSFTGCTIAGDTFGVGADDLSGTIKNTNAIFHATSNKFTINIPNDTNLSAGAQNAISGAMYWNSTDGQHYYYLDSSGIYQHVPAPNHSLPTFAIPSSGNTLQLKIPYMPINSMRMYFGVGAPPNLVVNSGNGVTAANDTSASSVIDFIEGTLDASGADNVVQLGLRNFATWNINTTQVDQFGMPITLTGNVYNSQDVPSLASVGVTLSPNVARDAIFKEFEALHSSSTDPYSQLVQPSSDPNQPLRILNPSNLSLTQSTALGYAFDQYIQQMFEHPSALQLSYNGIIYTATATTDPATHTYNVLEFSSTAAGHLDPVYIYEPFFSSNAPNPSSLSTVSYAGKPSAPTWLTANETPGQMVLANNGVFGDSLAQTGNGYNTADQAMLGAFEDDLVAALNRGVTSLPVSEWGDSTKFYVTDPAYNQYAAFLHNQTINGTPIFINHQSYAIAFDDNNGYGSFITYLNQNDLTATLGAWQTPGPSGNNDGFLTAVYQDVLHRAVDPSGHTYWLGLLAGGISRTDVSQAIVNSVEHRTDIIEGFYTGLLNRAADSAGLTAYLQLFAGGWTASQIKCLFYGSNEYFQNAGSNNTGFTTALYQDELHRAADSQAEAAMIQALAAGQSRTYIASLVVGSPEAEMDRVNKYYLDYLLRPADAAGLAYWNSVLARTDQDSLIEAGLLGSAEFFNRT